MAIERKLLKEFINTAPTKRVTLVTAPAGYGKTTLLSQWVSVSGSRTAWIDLENQDNCCHYLLKQLVSSFQLAGILNELDIEKIQADSSSPDEYLWASMLNGILILEDTVFLVLDNMHRLRDRSANTLIDRLVKQAPKNLNIILSGRERPNISLTKLLTQYEVYCIDDKDLAFCENDIRSLFNKSNIKINASEAYQLKSEMEGWVTGIQLWNFAYKKLNNNILTVMNHSVRNLVYSLIRDYMFEEVINHLSLSIIKFLDRTSIVNSFNLELAELLNESADTEHSLRTVKKYNLFIRNSNLAGWYSYHPLFKIALYLENSERDRKNTSLLHRKAADWLIEKGHLGEGLYQYAQCRNLPLLLKILEENTFNLLREGEINKIADSLANIPSIIGRDHYALAMTEASVVHVSKDINRIKMSIKKLELLLQEQPGFIDSLRLRQTIIYLSSQAVYLNGNLRYGVRLCSEELDLCMSDSSPNAAASVIRFHRATCYFSLGYLDRAYSDAIHALDELKKLNLTGYINSISFLAGQIELSQGRITEAEQRFLNISVDSVIFNTSNFYDVYYFLGLALVREQQNRLLEAESLLNKAVAIAMNFKPSAILPWVFHYLARISWVKGDINRAEELWVECQQLALSNQLYIAYRLAGAYRVRMIIDTNKNSQSYIDSWQKEWQRTTKHYGRDTLPEEKLASISVLNKKGKNKEALQSCDTLINELKKHKQIDFLLDAMILRVKILESNKDESVVISYLNEVIEVSYIYGIRNLFFRKGRYLIKLVKLGLSIKKLTRTTFVEDLLAELQQSQELLSSELNTLPFEQLTKRELDVLKLIVKGQDNAKIAESLFVGLSTVKTHINSIFKKMEVFSRDDAIEKAAKFNILK